MHTPLQSVFLTGIIALFSLDILISLFGALFSPYFYELNPLFAPFTGTPALYLLLLIIPKIALLWGFVSISDRLNAIMPTPLYGTVVCATAFTIQLVYAGWLFGLNFFT
ncbi:MAG: hypothetical protein QCH35_01000 [Methanomicrobiaceae archaeon]|nr:hypothetical protein [Methanomicrobiaceae archaeon]